MTQKASWKQPRKCASLWNCPFMRHSIWETYWMEKLWGKGQNLGNQKSKAVTDGVTLCSSHQPRCILSRLFPWGWKDNIPISLSQPANCSAASHLKSSVGVGKVEDLRKNIQAWLKEQQYCLGAGGIALCQWLQEAQRVWSSFVLLCQALSPSAAVTCLLAGTGCEPPDGESWAQGPWYFFVTSHKARPTLLPLC